MGSTTSRLAVIAALSTLWPTIAASQQGGVGTVGAGTGGVQVDIGVDTKLTYDDNFRLTPGTSPGGATISDTVLTFGLTNVTSAYDLSLTASSVLRVADIPGRTVSGFEDPSVRLRFVTDSTNSRLTLTGNYRFVDREFLNPFQIEREEQQFGTLVGNGGTLRQTGYGLKYETGLVAPLGFTLDLNHANKDYENVLSTQVFDERTDSARGTVTMRFSPVATGRVFAGIVNYEAADLVQTDRRTVDYGVGIAYEINPVLNLDAQIAQTEVETDRLTGLTTRSGLSGSVTLTQTVANGSIFGTLSSSVNQNGERVTLSFGRDLQLRTGTLRAVIGATQADVGDTSFIGSVRYSQQLKRSTLSFNLDRSASTNALDQEIVDTRVGVDYVYDIDSLSRLRLSLDWGRTEDTGATGAITTDLTNLQAAYSRDLTPDWALTGGVTLRKREETGLPDANSTAVFLSLGRTFSFRP